MNMKKIITKALIITGITTPLLTFAIGEPGRVNNLKNLVDLIIAYFGYAVIIIISLAVLMFVYNVFKYFIAGGDDVSAKKEAGLYVMYSVIGFFVILSLWGLVYILTNTFNLTNNQPQLPFGIFNSASNTTLNGNSTVPPSHSQNAPATTNINPYE